jgi:hypothetical protein
LLKLDDSETADSGFFFLFDHFDESTSRFVYNAYGTFTDNTSFDNPACIGSGAGTASHLPWSSERPIGRPPPARLLDVVAFAYTLD